MTRRRWLLLVALSAVTAVLAGSFAPTESNKMDAMTVAARRAISDQQWVAGANANHRTGYVIRTGPAELAARLSSKHWPVLPMSQASVRLTADVIGGMHFDGPQTCYFNAATSQPVEPMDVAIVFRGPVAKVSIASDGSTMHCTLAKVPLWGWVVLSSTEGQIIY